MLCSSVPHALLQYQRRTLPPAGHTSAAVLLPLYEADGQLHLLLTRRTDTVRDHKGQICFPGGATEIDDADAEATALREALEEVGIRPEGVEILGRLDDLVTHTGFHITPVVGRLTWPCLLLPDPAEVAEILYVPLLDLQNNMTQGCSERFPGIPIYYFRSGDHTIWGITGWIVKNFLDVIRGG
ncbi:MAG TPA: CoA pyrophosphatase [Candidatus Xenobia bacterium]|jgi:8-oxo-dGTP pyrophosphatase MutT (NUDIX family)